MDIFRFLILIVVIAAVVAIVGWFLRKSKVVIPYPVMIVFYAVLAIVAILFLVSLAGMGPMAVRW